VAWSGAHASAWVPDVRFGALKPAQNRDILLDALKSQEYVVVAVGNTDFIVKCLIFINKFI